MNKNNNTAEEKGRMKENQTVSYYFSYYFLDFLCKVVVIVFVLLCAVYIF